MNMLFIAFFWDRLDEMPYRLGSAESVKALDKFFNYN